MTNIAAYKFRFDISIIITMYDLRGQIKRRTFYVRNLEGDSLESQVERCKQISHELANEIHYLTRVGVDKIDIKSEKKKVDQLVFQLTSSPGETAMVHIRRNIQLCTNLYLTVG